MENQENQMVLSIKKSTLYAKKPQEVRRLTYPHNLFISCDYEEHEELFDVTYNIEQLKSVKDIRKERKLDQLKFLISISQIESLLSDYIIDIAPENLWYDYAYSPKILQRDIVPADLGNQELMFLHQYKSLVGYVLQNKYSYQDYYNGGLDLLKGKSLLGEIHACENIREIKDILYREHETEEKKLQGMWISVSKRKYQQSRILNIVSIILVVFLMGYSGFVLLYQLPLKQKLETAGNAYIRSDYEGVIVAIKDVSKTQMPHETKYILAVSYIRSEGLGNEQKNNILQAVTLKSNDDILNYWIDIGQLNCDDAISLAQKIGNDQYLLYAYMKKCYDLEKNSKLPENEKQKQIEDIKKKMESISEDINKELPFEQETEQNEENNTSEESTNETLPAGNENPSTEV